MELAEETPKAKNMVNLSHRGSKYLANNAIPLRSILRDSMRKSRQGQLMELDSSVNPTSDGSGAANVRKRINLAADDDGDGDGDVTIEPFNG